MAAASPCVRNGFLRAEPTMLLRGQAQEFAHTTTHSFTEGLFSPGRQPSVSSPLTRGFFLMTRGRQFSFVVLGFSTRELNC